MSIKKLIYKKRACDHCKSKSSESLWNYKHFSPTTNGTYVWKINNVRCNKCGFIFVSPAPISRSLNAYYKSLHSIFTNQKVDYSISKRLEVIKKFSINKNSYLEIGGNKTNAFHKQVKKIFKKTFLVEINNDHTEPYKSISDIVDIKFNVIAAYFVLEHLNKPIKFLYDCSKRLDSNGILIIEVPNVREYGNKSDGLMFEHLSHFSPKSLELLGISAGLKKIYVGTRSCSRSFGFVIVFKKDDNKRLLKNREPILVKETKSDVVMFKNGVKNMISFHKKMDEIFNKIKSYKSKETLIWGANINTSILLSKYKMKNKIVVVDSDHRKENYLYDISKIKVLTPFDIRNKINSFKFIIIMTKRHSKEIIKNIRQNLGKNLVKDKIVILDI